jgi:hypothetical protein
VNRKSKLARLSESVPRESKVEGDQALTGRLAIVCRVFIFNVTGASNFGANSACAKRAATQTPPPPALLARGAK